MASTYTSFLKAPSASYLANDASLNYITTTTSINESAAILKHLQAQSKLVTKKEERVLYSVEAPNALFLETETTLEFNAGGGAYLPSMDENLLDEKVVTIPILHVVSFDAEQKIKQIRLHWDQGTLLKQVEAIGRTGRNWPIRDGKAQIEAINKSLRSSGVDSSANKAPLSNRNANEVVIGQHKRGDSKAVINRDPQELFSPRDTNAGAGAAYDGPGLAPRASAKPAPREYGELFAGEDGAPPGGSQLRSPSPTKAEGTVFKSGAGKHHTGNRLFDDNDGDANLRSPERKKTYNQKYQHFSFGDGEDVPESKRPTSGGRNSKAQPTFSFEDFNTPLKVNQKKRRDDEVHWGGEDPPSPPLRPIVHAPRKDADTHFQMTDDAPAHEPTKPPSRGNVDNARRGDDFGAHYKMTDSPAPTTENDRPSSRGQRSDMESHWGHGTPPIERKGYKTAGDGMGGRKGARDILNPSPEKQIYRTAGDGMGGRKGAGGRSWGIGDDSDPDVQEAKARARRTKA